MAALSRPTAASVAAALRATTPMPHCWRPRRPASSCGSATGFDSRTRCSPRRSTDRHRPRAGGSSTAARRRRLRPGGAGSASRPQHHPRRRGSGGRDRGRGGFRCAPWCAGGGRGALRGGLSADAGGAAEDLARRLLGAAGALAIAGDLDGARSLANRAFETARGGSLERVLLLLLGSLASYTETIEARIGYHEHALAEAGDDEALRPTSCSRSWKRSSSIRSGRYAARTRRSSSCARG